MLLGKGVLCVSIFVLVARKNVHIGLHFISALCPLAPLLATVPHHGDRNGNVGKKGTYQTRVIKREGQRGHKRHKGYLYLNGASFRMEK